MFVTRMLCGVCLCGLASAVVSAAEDSFVAEGLADPAHLGARAVGKSPQEIDRLLLDQAYLDAASHLGVYTRGIQFKQEPGADGRYAFFTAAAEFQPLGGLSPQTKTLRMLKSGLGLAEVTYGSDSMELLNLPKDYFSLPLYRVKGEYQNPNNVMSKISMHWGAISNAYHEALTKALAKLYPGKVIVYVHGRAYPVRVVEAELLPAGASASASAAASGAPAPAAASVSSASSAETAATATAASSATTAAAPFDSKQFLYHLEMDVRLRIDEVKFAEETSATSAASASSAAAAAAPSSDSSATSAAPAVAPSSAASASSAAAAAAP